MYKKVLLSFSFAIKKITNFVVIKPWAFYKACEKKPNRYWKELFVVKCCKKNVFLELKHISSYRKIKGLLDILLFLVRRNRLKLKMKN